MADLVSLRIATLPAILVALALPGGAAAQDPDSLRSVADTLAGQLVDSLATTLSGDSVQESSGLRDPSLPPDARLHLDHITVGYGDTPLGMGLMKTAMIEAEIASAWVRVAGMDSLGLTRMRGAMRNVLHALDPVEASSGAGMGYGFRRAAEGVLAHAELAMADSTSVSLAFHGPYVLRAASAGRALADDAIALAHSVQRASDPVAALRDVNRLAEVLRSMVYGRDADGDGRIGHTDGEVGLAQATYHLGLVYRRDGLEMPDVRPDSLVNAMGLDTLGVVPERSTGRR